MNHSLMLGVIGVMIGFFISFGFVVLAWTAPTAEPPNDNVDAPVNVSSDDQVKDGGLSVDALAVFGNAAMTGTLEVGGNVTALGFFHSSDMRLKEDISTLSGMSVLEKIRGVSFSWKYSGKKGVGVIAQEIEEVLPSAVQTDPTGMKSVDYDQLIAVLIEAVKEQQREIDVLQYEIESLKAR